ncbi:MAG: AAA family ATPase [Anaerolineae bacterium]|nr:AAA family ATPase [Anaerolineae bacterium]
MSHNEALIQALRQALEATPGNVALQRHLAELLMESGDFAAATQAYRRTLDLAPDDADVKRCLAEAYHRQGRSDVALVIIEELLQDAPPSAPLLELASEVRKTAGEPEFAGAHDLFSKAAADLKTSAAKPVAKPAPRVAVPVEDETGMMPSEIERPRITFADVGGMQKLKEEIRMKIIYPLSHPEIYRAYGKSLGGGILMYGPPGCGKTHLARATAGEVNATFLSTGLHDVLEMWLGKSEQNLHAIFETARAYTPCVLFFDEVDALGAKRSDMRYSAGRHVINQFLAELDGMEASNEGVLVLAATNAPWHLDSAMRRPGRFDRVIFVPPPDFDARAAILRILLAGKPADRIDYGRLARATREFSGADLRGVVDVAVENKLREAMETGVPDPLTTRDLLAVIKTMRPTTKEWFESARNYALYANQSGLYDDILDYLKGG